MPNDDPLLLDAAIRRKSRLLRALERGPDREMARKLRPELKRLEERLRAVRGDGAVAEHVAGSSSFMEERAMVERAIDELARVFHVRDVAVVLAVKAGFPRSMMPTFTTPLVFWTNIVEESRNGVLRGGVRPIMARAAEMYPNNPAFALYRSDVSGEPTVPEQGSTHLHDRRQE